MSMLIDVAQVGAVLLVDGWHGVKPGTFGLDSYEFAEMPDDPNDAGLILHGGGESGICATGFYFVEWDEDENWIGGPLTSVLAITYEPWSEAKD